jgi:hypothetical protein
MSIFGNNLRDVEIKYLQDRAETLQKQIWELKADQAMLLRHLKLTRVSTPASSEYVPEDDPRAVAAMRNLQAMYAQQQNMAPNPLNNLYGKVWP